MSATYREQVAKRQAATKAQLTATVDQHISALRDRHRRRATLITLLDKATLR